LTFGCRRAKFNNLEDQLKKNSSILKIVLALILFARLGGQTMDIDKETQDGVRRFLLAKHGETNKLRIDKGLQQVAAFWRPEDGSLEAYAKFCRENFIGSPERLQGYFKRLERNFEVLNGHLNQISLDLKRPLHLDWGEITPCDERFGEFEPTAHLSEDMFDSKIAFEVLLNFPTYTLAEKTEQGPEWNRLDWAYARCGDLFLSRVPARLNQKAAAALSDAETYIAEYNIFMGSLIDNHQKTLFPENLKLISHWGLRDRIKALYADRKGLAGQEMIYEVLKRIVQQDIPQPLVNRGEYLWNPFNNKVFKGGKEIVWTPEPNSRYLHLLDIFKAVKDFDPFFPSLPSHMQRKFELERELPAVAVEKLFADVLTSAPVKTVAALVQGRLGRKLQPFDIWYNGFKASGKIPEAELDRRVSQKYPDLKAFEKDLRNILQQLGFTAKAADFLAGRIAVDPARGAGHAWGALMKGEKSHLRTRVPAGGMNYQGFQVAMHELGHCVEQTLSLQKVDSYLMAGVPNTAISEAFAFIFQNRNLEVLGVKNDDRHAGQLQALDTLWMTYEIMGVALVDMKVWDWMYQKPDANPEALRKAVLAIAREVWNQYYADLFGVRDQIILAVYSHMIDAALYLPDYPLGHLVEFQLESFLAGKSLGQEMERMCQAGRLIPQLWLKNAVGEEISAAPLLQAAEEALKVIKK
jgi:hypothetical protein